MITITVLVAISLIVAAGIIRSQIKEKPLVISQPEEEIHSHYCGCPDCFYTRLVAPKAETIWWDGYLTKIRGENDNP